MSDRFGETALQRFCFNRRSAKGRKRLKTAAATFGLRSSAAGPVRTPSNKLQWTWIRSDLPYRFRLVLLLNPVIENNAFHIVEINFTSRQILPFVVGADRCSMALL